MISTLTHLTANLVLLLQNILYTVLFPPWYSILHRFYLLPYLGTLNHFLCMRYNNNRIITTLNCKSKLCYCNICCNTKESIAKTLAILRLLLLQFSSTCGTQKPISPLTCTYGRQTNISLDILYQHKQGQCRNRMLPR